LKITLPGRSVAVLQSNYLPWKGYFDIINDVDLFIFYDDVQFTKNDWRNRNLVKTPGGTAWITVPVGQDIRRRICDVKIPDTRWAKVHWKTLCQYYSRAPHFARYREFFEDAYLGRKWETLSALNHHVVRNIAGEFLGSCAAFGDSRDFALSGAGSDRLLALLKLAGATRYVSGPAARDYLDESAFRAAGVEVAWKSYSGYPEYPQFFPPFEHRVSVVDLLFQAGADAPELIWGWRDQAGGRP
jgi:hypothetical protein